MSELSGTRRTTVRVGPSVVTPRAARDDVALLTVVRVLVAPDPASIVARPTEVLDLDEGGVRGDRHHGVLRPSGSREVAHYPRGTMIRNRRQLTLVSVEELAEVADRLGVPQVLPEWLGANVLVRGAPALSALPAGSRRVVPGVLGLVGEGVNQPCRLPGRVLAAQYPGTDVERRFARVAYGRRGIAASVERPGLLAAGDVLEVHPPEPHAFLE